MSCRAISAAIEDIHVADMLSGEIGVIVRWGDTEKRLGQVVQRFDDTLVVLGEHHDYSSSFAQDRIGSPNCYVRLLPAGTLIKVTSVPFRNQREKP